eukprot:3717541-Pyramimonas_sp.AAC.1
MERLHAVGGVRRLAKCLHVNTEVGLPDDEVKQRPYADVFGRNVIPEQPIKPFWVRPSIPPLTPTFTAPRGH